MTGERPAKLPGDLSPAEEIDRIVRVDHAGEYGAVRIYEGQLAVLKNAPCAPLIRKMAEQEREHRAHFEKLMVERKARPTVLIPIWHVAGFALGAATALLGEKAAMACTAAVEEVIDGHYAGQEKKLDESEKDLRATIGQYRADEIEHRDTAYAHGAKEAPAYEMLSAAVKFSTRLAIWLSERV